MKLNKKKLLSMALVLLLICTISFGTLAWFNDSEKVTNKFMVASSEDDTADEIFSVDIFEEVDTNGDGDSDTVGEGDEVANPVYEDMLPGSERTKKPVVKNTGTYDQYVRVTVTLDNAIVWKAMAEKYNLDLFDLFVGYNDNEWDRRDLHKYDEQENTYTFVFYYVGEEDGKLVKGDESFLFTGVKVPGELTQDDMILFHENQFSMTIVADAVQADNLYNKDGLNVTNAYDAFVAVGWDVGTEYGA